MPAGGRRPGAGRPRGARNAATADQVMTISEMARSYTEAALNALVSIATSSESDAARVSAANAILDRGYGKATQPVDHNIDATLADRLAQAEARIKNG